MLLSLVAPAWAQQDAALCKGGFTNVDWTVRLQSAEDAFASFEVEVARRLLDKTRAQVVCLEHVADPALVARLAQDLAWLAFFDQDEIAAQRWILMARFTDPGLALPESIPPDHPLRELAAGLDDPAKVVADGRALPPKGGGLFLDGRLVGVPEAWPEVPGLLQVADGEGRIVDTRWIDGAQLPEEYLGPDGPPPRPPRWWDPEEAPGTMVAERAGGGPRVGALVAGGGFAVLSGALYALGAVSTGGLDTATSEDALAAARSRTNALAMGSAAAGVGAVGLGITAFVSADGLTLQF